MQDESTAIYSQDLAFAFVTEIIARLQKREAKEYYNKFYYSTKKSFIKTIYMGTFVYASVKFPPNSRRIRSKYLKKINDTEY